MKKKCIDCGKELHIGFFNEQSGDDCVLCAASRVELAHVEKHDHEEVEDTGCAGGACTL